MHGPSKDWMLAATVHVTVLAAASTSLAQSPDSGPAPAGVSPPAGDDVVILKNGELLRGTIIVPEVQTRIQLATGEIVTVPWQNIDRIEHGAAPPVVPVEPTPSSSDEPASEVWVHVDAPRGTLLLQQTASHADWETACAAPCDKRLPTAFRYRVGGGGVTLSADFALSAPPGTRETLVVDRASRSLFVLGVVGMAAGGLVVTAGLYAEYTLVLGSYLAEVPFDWSGSGNIALLTAAGIGALVVVGGALLVHANLHTKVTQSSGAHAGMLLPDSWTRTPTLGTASEQRYVPAAAGIPIFSGRF
jgi:hypothetical protein